MTDKPAQRLNRKSPLTPKNAPVIPAGVYINVSDKSPAERAERAKGRIDNLSRKLIRLKERPFDGQATQALVNAEASLKAWRKVLATAEFEINYTEGGI